MRYYSSILIVSVCIVWVGQLLQATPASDKCSHRVLKKRETTCLEDYNLTDHIVDGIPIALFEESFTQYCRYSPLAVACMQDLFESCKNPYYDVQAYNKTFVKVCNNKLLYMYAEGFCNETTVIMNSCLKRYMENARRLASVPISDETRCFVLNRLRDCLHFNESRMCKREYSLFLTSMYQGRFSSEICDVYTDVDWSNSVVNTDNNQSTTKQLGHSNVNSAPGLTSTSGTLILKFCLQCFTMYLYINYTS